MSAVLRALTKYSEPIGCDGIFIKYWKTNGSYT